jgi:hypothetical protein
VVPIVVPIGVIRIFVTIAIPFSNRNRIGMRARRTRLRVPRTIGTTIATTI